MYIFFKNILLALTVNFKAHKPHKEKTMAKKKKYTAEFKVKIALEAIAK